jgi:PPM family protein phosphatase
MNVPYPPIQLTLASGQIQGGRQRQEDCFLVRAAPEALFVLLADGLGGHAMGDEASHSACATASWDLARSLRGAAADVPDVDTALRHCIVTADQDVSAIRPRYEYEHRPASTLIAGVFQPAVREFHAASVGDSLCYHLRDDQLDLVFRPQSLSDPASCAVGYNIGVNGSGIDVLQPPLELRPGDRFLFATDGILTLGYDDIRAQLKHPTAREAVEGLLQLLLTRRHPEQDNATLVAVFVEADPEEGA